MNSTIRQLKDMINSDKLIFQEIKSLIGTWPRTNEVIERMFILKDKVNYQNASKILQEAKEKQLKLTNTSEAGNLIKIESDLNKLLQDWYKITLFMRGLKRKKAKTKITPSVKRASRVPIMHLDLSNLNEDMKSGISQFTQKQLLPFVLGKLPDGTMKTADLVKLPHLLVAGGTGSGKSVFLNSLIVSMLYQKSSLVKLVLVDPKRVEFSLYKGIPQLWGPVVSGVNDADELIEALTGEMENRLLALEHERVKNIETLNGFNHNAVSYIVVVIDEFADLMMLSGSRLTDNIVRLASLGRAAGIHIVMATQRPVAKILEGLIKTNMPSRIAFRVSSRQDSKIILDRNGAEKLNGNGDMLFLERGELTRCQGLYVSDDEIRKIIELPENSKEDFEILERAL